MISKTRNTLLIALGVLVAVELGLQLRSQLRYGQSVFNVLTAETTYVQDADTGLKLLRPNHRIEGALAVIETNAVGLRDGPLPEAKPAREYRIAILGASTVMGAYTRNNSDTLSSQLQEQLNDSGQIRMVRVINAGIAGYSLDDQRRMVERLLSRFDIDHYVLYAGFNDLSGYCQQATATEQVASQALPSLQLPSWLLTTELITKNTVALRSSLARATKMVDPETLDTTAYENDMRKLAAALQATGRPVLVVGNAWAFRRGMPAAQRSRMSETARYYSSCFDTDGLEVLFEGHKEIIRRVASDYGIDYFDLADELPGGSEYFGDSSHFSVVGTRSAATSIANHLVLTWPAAVTGG